MTNCNKLRINEMTTEQVIPNSEVAQNRGQGVADLKATVVNWARRATSPAKRQAMSELEHEVTELERRWRERGLIPDGLPG